jgi:hypothetical protein
MSIRDLIVIVVTVEFGLHYFPWHMLIGGRLPRLAAYVLGLLGMMVPLSAWLMDKGETDVMQTLWIVNASAGLTVFALYGLDRYLKLERRDVEAEEREALMKRMIKEVLDEQGK